MYSIEVFETQKVKVMKYITYKKRTEFEVRNKFSQTIETKILDDIIEYIKEAGYINDEDYIKKAANEFLMLKTLSIKELRYKLSSKGLDRDLVEDYISSNQEMLEEYEMESAKKIYIKREKTKEKDEIKLELLKKGYKNKTINIVLEGE